MKGYLNNAFIQRKKDNLSEYYGTMTDKKHKVDVLVTLEDGETIEADVGCEIEVVGDLQELGI